MSRRLLDYDPLTRVATYHHYDDVERKTYIEEVQDASRFVEASKDLQNDPDYKRKGIKNDWMHAAIIPIGVQYQWLRQHGVNLHNKDHWPAVRRLLNSREYSYLKTINGKV